MVDSKLDVRDQFMGLKNLRRPYVPVPVGMKDEQGKHVPMSKRAQSAADFLGDRIWGEAQETQRN